MSREDFNNDNVGFAAKYLRDSQAFAAYRSTNEGDPRTDLMFKIFEQLLAFIHVNLLSATSPQSWLRSFLMLRSFNLLPAPIASAEQIAAAERNAPADDGQPVAYHDDMVTPVTYTIRGKVVRYSNDMLKALTSAGYQKVMQLNRVDMGNPYIRKEQELAAAQKAADRAICEDGNPIMIMDGAPFIVNGKKYSHQMVEKMSGEDYRKLLRLPRGNSREGAAQK